MMNVEDATPVWTPVFRPWCPTVTVVDTTLPALIVPTDVTVEQETADGTAVPLTATATDICDANVDLTSDELAVYPLGATVVTLAATDDSGNVSTATMTVTVEDTTPSDFSLNLLKDTLWPANHKMILCATVTDVADICDAAPDVDIVVESNEPLNGPGSGNTPEDWQIVQKGEEWEIHLRAERDGPCDGREYTITVTVTDFSGNENIKDATVTVPHDQGNGNGGGGNGNGNGKKGKK